MASNNMGAGRFRFGQFELDTANLALRRKGALVHLQSQPAQVLAFLVERSDQIVSRDDLRNAIWGDKTFVDFAAGLNFCISQIRSALQDDSARPVYIQTVPKLGYRFIAPVEQLTGESPQQPHVAASRAPRLDWRKPAFAVKLAIVAALAFFGYRFRSVQSADTAPILAVVHFDNETSDPALANLTDGLTDNVVEQLTTQSRGAYRVIGNAQILRLPRQQRDLHAISASLNAGYVVLGQVQTNGSAIRILAHLIRLPDQTHIWVVRIDRSLTDPLSLETEAASKIAAEFSARMSANPDQATSFPSASH